MARQTKAGIAYFSHDTDMLQDRKIRIIKAKHKLLGYAVFLRLLEELYRDEGYYLLADEEFNILFADDNNIDLDVYNLILNDCIEVGLFNINLFKKYKILSSRRIQSNYLEATERRKNVTMYKEYLLLNVDIVALNVDIVALNVYIGTQSKVDKTKVDKNRIYNDVVSYLNEKINTKYQATSKETKKHIDARVKENYCLEDFKKVIDIKSKEWLNTEHAKYLRPETLFGNKFESYLNQKEREYNNGKNNQVGVDTKPPAQKEYFKSYGS